MRLAIIAYLIMWAISLVSCEGGKEDFLPCNLDPKVHELGLCEDSAQGSTTIESCVAPNHPQCPESVCLSWGNTGPFCTGPCGGDSDCPEEAVCQTYGVASEGANSCYCVTRAAIGAPPDGSALVGTCQSGEPLTEGGGDEAPLSETGDGEEGGTEEGEEQGSGEPAVE